MSIDYEKEFNDFLRIVSHDVRAPIRHINDFYKYLIDDLNITFTDDQLELKGHLESAISLLKNQMDALLEYSRTLNAPTKKDSFNVNILIADIIESLKISGLNTSCIVNKTYDATNITFNKRALEISVKEVLKNGIIFQNDNPVVRINITSEASHATISIIDNGIGIDERFLEEIYLPFRQINKKGTYPGIGMGLTLAKKTMSINGGDISIDINPEGGTIATVLIPNCR